MKKSEVIGLYGGTVRDWRRHKNGGGWVHKDANVFESAYIGGSALVYGNAWVLGDALVYGDAVVSGNARVYGNARVCEGVHTATPSQVTRSDGYMFTAYRDNGVLMITAGCREFTWDQAVAHWGNPEHHKHAESMRIINYLRAEVEAREKERV